MQTRSLGNSGLDVTTISFGGGGIGNLYKPSTRNDAEAVLDASWNAGIRFFDTAPRYGHGLSERRLGDFLRQKPRDSYVLSTKVGRLLTPLRGRTMTDYGFADPLPFEQEYDYSYDGIMRSFEASLHRLGLDQIDVLLMHDIGRDTHGSANDHRQPIAFDGGFKAMTELRDQGLVRAIGLGVNEVDVCLAALEHADLDCFLLAGRYSVLDHAGAAPLLAACRQRGARLIVGGVFNSGILATGPRPGAMFNYAPASPEILARTQRIEQICLSHGVPLASAALQFPLHSDMVASVLLGVSNQRNLERNLEGLAAKVPDQLWRDLEAQGLLDPAAV
jgi:D-threo-aldose 1-dehydrogenase